MNTHLINLFPIKSKRINKNPHNTQKITFNLSLIYKKLNVLTICLQNIKDIY